MQGPEPRDSIFERAQLGLDQAADSHGVPSPADEEGHRLPNLLKRKPELLRRTNELQSVDDTLGVDAVVVREALGDRKSTRLNSSHITISYAVFCLKKK